MSISPDWTTPERTHTKNQDLDAIREGMWNTLFIAVASVGGFQIGWDLIASTFDADGFPLTRRWKITKFNQNNEIYMVWNYTTGARVTSIEVYHKYLGQSDLLTVPGTCTFGYVGDYIDTYTWS